MESALSIDHCKIKECLLLIYVCMLGMKLFTRIYNRNILLQKEVTSIVQQSLKSIKVSERGVCVQASTLGSLEALIEFLKTSKIPVSVLKDSNIISLFECLVLYCCSCLYSIVKAST